MGVKLLESLQMQTGLPLDDRNIVDNIEQRNLIDPTVRYIGMEVYVKDENKKYRLEKGIENFNWTEIKAIANASELITDPEHLTVSQTEKDKWNSKADEVHTHTKNQITDFPVALKNPTSLSIQLNGGTANVYDGSSAKSVNITPASIGAQPAGSYANSSHTHTATQVTQDTTHRFVTDVEKNTWNGKAEASHTHDSVYSKLGHNHDNTYSKLGHGHAWGEISGKPGSFTPAAHNQASNTITAMTGYSKPTSTSAIVVGDTLNAAIGKLEKALDGKQPSGNYSTNGHTHDERYFTETEVNNLLKGKANTSHGNHVPATQTASNKVFLRNDNTWATITPANIGAQPAGSYAAASHTHPATQITQDSTHRFSTDAEKTKWNGKADAHSHPYLNLAGGTLTGALTVNSTIKATGTVTCSDCVTTSDERLKKDIVKIDNALEKVNQLNGYTFLKEGDEQRTTGVLAQELLNVLPEAVFEREDGYYSVSYGNIVGLLIEAIKELQVEVKRLKGDK